MLKKTDGLLLEKDQLRSLSETILHEAKIRGAYEAEVSIAADKGFTVTAHNGEVETVEYNQDKVIEITVFFGKKSGSSSLSDIRPEAIKAAVEAACHIAKFTDEDPAAGLAEKDELAFHYPSIATAFPWDISVEKAMTLACECEAIAMQYDKRILNAEEVTIATSDAINLYANTHGFCGISHDTQHEISCVLIAKENEEMQRDYSYTVSVDPHDLKSIDVIAKEAAERTVKRLGARRLPTMRAPVIFLAEEARGLIGHFVAAISGRNIYRKSSFLVDHLGKKIFPDHFYLQEHPFLPRALGSTPFDDNGVATRENIFVEDGILRTFALSVYSARKLKMKTTGNAGGIHNLTVKTGQKNLAELIKSVNKGLLVTELMGQGVNLLTGNYSRGVGGYWIEHGEIQFPVHEITIAGKLQDMYANIVEVGNDVDVRGNVRTGSILINEMMIAGS